MVNNNNKFMGYRKLARMYGWEDGSREAADLYEWLQLPDGEEKALRSPYCTRGRVLVGEEAKQRRLRERLKLDSEMTPEELHAREEARRRWIEKSVRRDEKKRRRLKRLEERTAPARWQRVREKLDAVWPVRLWPSEMYEDLSPVEASRLERSRPDVLGPGEFRRLLWEMFEQGDKFDMKKWEPFRSSR